MSGQSPDEAEVPLAHRGAEVQTSRSGWRQRIAESDTVRGIVAKLLNSSVAFAYCSVLPYLSVFYQSKGYDARSIGVLLAIVPFVQCIAPLWTALADKTHWNFQLWLFCFVAGVILQIGCYFAAFSFPLLAALVLLTSALRAPVWPFVDSISIGLVGRAKYGNQRLFMSAFWGVGAIGTSFLVFKVGIWVIFVLHGALAPLVVIFGVFIWKFLPLKQESTDGGEKTSGVATEGNGNSELGGVPAASPAKNRGFWGSMAAAILNVKMAGFLVLSVFIGIVHAAPSFLFVYLGERFDVAKSFWFFGVLVVASITIEVPVFFFSDFLIRKLKIFPMMMLSLAFMAIRTFLYTLFANPWAFVVPELTHGITYASNYAAGVRAASVLVGPEMQATGQGLYYMAYSSLGIGIGQLLIGTVYKAVGPILTFRAVSVTCIGLIVVAVSVFVGHWAFSRKRATHQVLPTDPTDDIAVDEEGKATELRVTTEEAATDDGGTPKQ